MPEPEPEHSDVPLGVFAACLHIYHDLAHHITDTESDLFEAFIDSYVSRKKVLTQTLDAIKTIIQRVWQES